MKLEEIIDLESLQKLQDYFAEATGFAAITVDYQGNPLLKYSSFSPFCEKMRKKPDFYKKCIRSDAYVSLEAVRNGVSCIHRCHAGLIDFAIPIIVNGEYLASMMGGQVKTDDSLAKLLRKGLQKIHRPNSTGVQEKCLLEAVPARKQR